MAFSNSRPKLNNTSLDSRFGRLVFEDHFNGLDINRSVWDAGHYNTDWISKNYDCITYTDGGGVQRSVLRIWPKYDASLDPNVIESKNGFGRRDISTGNMGFRQLYGYFEASMKLNSGLGVWPAFWLFNDTYKREIDIMEAYPGGGVASGWSDSGLHPINYGVTTWEAAPLRGADWASTLANAKPTQRLDTGFHTYGVEWNSTTVTYYFDGDPILSHTHNGIMNQPMLIILDLWFGSASNDPVLGQTPEGTTNSFEVDWVRSWELSNNSGYTTGPAATDGASPGAVVQPTPTPSAGTAGGAVPYGEVPTMGAMSFYDGFDAASLNTAAWKDQEWYLAPSPTANYSLGNSKLRIFPTAEFTNRSITTDGTFLQRYGYFESSMKLPRGAGVWPAFWLYSHPGNDRPEIDIMEAYSGGGPDSGWSDGALQPTNYGFTLHKANGDYSYHEIPFAKVMTNYLPAIRLDDSFHVYGVLWTKDFIQFYFDGKPIGPKWTNDYWHWSMYIEFDLWYGSASGTPSVSQTPLGLSNAFEIEYCSAWLMADGTSSVTTNLPAPTPPSGTTPPPSGGTTPPSVSNTYQANDQFSIRYESGTIKYLHNGIVKRIVEGIDPLKTFYFDSSFYSPGASLLGVSFGKLGTVDWSAITGAGKPEDNATAGATIGVNVTGQMTDLVAKELIAPKAIGNDLIGDVIKSQGYIPGITGWKLDKLGNMELNSAVFRGTIEGPLVKTDNIVSRSATWFEFTSRSATNGQTQVFDATMEKPGSIMVVVNCGWKLSGVQTDASFSLTANLNGSTADSTFNSGNGFIDSNSVAILGRSWIEAGPHKIYVTPNHNLSSGYHTVTVQIFRSFR